jgi:hypothetical protein
LRALLLFPFRPSDAIPSLEGRIAPYLAPLAPAAVLAAYLLARGAAAADALVAGAALLLCVAGAGLAGGLVAPLAARFTGATFRWTGRLGIGLLFAAWTAPLFVALVVALQWAGAGVAAPLYAALVLVCWAVAVGAAVVAPDEDSEGGRNLVGGCLGMAGALAGFWGALMLVQAHLLVVVPAPTDGPDFERADALVVRVSRNVQRGDLLLLRERNGREAVLARVGETALEPSGKVDSASFASREWDIAGRVFFRFGGRLGGSVVGGGQTP